MSDPRKTANRSTIFITMIVAGVFFLGAALIPLLAGAQQKALEDTGFTIIPAVANYPAPQLALTDLQGEPVTINDYRGNVILVNNWATWCPPCQSEMPEIQVYYQAHAEDGFVVIGIESGGSAEQVSAFIRQYDLTFPIWLDIQGAALEAFKNWNLPSTYIIDRNGIVRLSWTGEINQQTLEQYVTPLLEKK